jgi:hypothetical protein
MSECTCGSDGLPAITQDTTGAIPAPVSFPTYRHQFNAGKPVTYTKQPHVSGFLLALGQLKQEYNILKRKKNLKIHIMHGYFISE